MAEESGLLKDRADNLLKQAVKALEAAQLDDIATKEQKQKIENQMA